MTHELPSRALVEAASPLVAPQRVVVLVHDQPMAVDRLHDGAVAGAEEAAPLGRDRRYRRRRRRPDDADDADDADDDVVGEWRSGGPRLTNGPRADLLRATPTA